MKLTVLLTFLLSCGLTAAEPLPSPKPDVICAPLGSGVRSLGRQGGGENLESKNAWRNRLDANVKNGSDKGALLTALCLREEGTESREPLFVGGSNPPAFTNFNQSGVDGDTRNNGDSARVNAKANYLTPAEVVEAKGAGSACDQCGDSWETNVQPVQFRPLIGNLMGRGSVEGIRQLEQTSSNRLAKRLGIAPANFNLRGVEDARMGKTTARSAHAKRLKTERFQDGQHEERTEAGANRSDRRQVGISFIDRIALVESGCSPQAIGDKGKSLGAFQIQECVWIEVSAFRKSKGLPTHDWSEAHTPIAREYATDWIYLLSRKLTAKLNRTPSVAEVYASYNLGMSGFQRRGLLLKNVPAHTKRAIERLSR